MINDKIKFVRNKRLLASRMDDEIVMMHPESGKYFALNPVAARIWELLETPHNLQEIVSKLLTEFDVTPETCKAQVSDFLENISEKKLIDKSE